MRGESCACRGQRPARTLRRCFVFSVRLGRNTRLKYPAHMSSMAYAGAQSLADMEFVRELCRQKNVPFYSTHADVPDYAKAHGCGIEDAARTLRYAFLNETAKKIGADAIALAHHRRDQAESGSLHAARGKRSARALRHADASGTVHSTVPE